jgi:hypothetical protein
MRKRRREKEIREGRGVTGEKLAGKTQEGHGFKPCPSRMPPWAEQDAGRKNPAMGQTASFHQEPKARNEQARSRKSKARSQKLS